VIERYEVVCMRKNDLISIALYAAWLTPWGYVISSLPEGRMKVKLGCELWHNNTPHLKWKLGFPITGIFIQGALIFCCQGPVRKQVIQLWNILSPSHRNILWYSISVLTLVRTGQQWVLPCLAVHTVTISWVCVIAFKLTNGYILYITLHYHCKLHLQTYI